MGEEIVEAFPRIWHIRFFINKKLCFLLATLSGHSFLYFTLNALDFVLEFPLVKTVLSKELKVFFIVVLLKSNFVSESLWKWHMLVCFVQFDASANFLPQLPHTYGFFPEWVILCFFILSCLTPALWLVFTEHATCLCLLWWVLMFEISVNALQQISHLKGFFPECIIICLFLFPGLANLFPHMLHWFFSDSFLRGRLLFDLETIFLLACCLIIRLFLLDAGFKIFLMGPNLRGITAECIISCLFLFDRSLNLFPQISHV